jgi:hypothetical protein
MGSCNITEVSPMPTSATWYNYLYMPHRIGGNYGAAQSDNCNYGTLLLFYMTSTNSAWFKVQLISGTRQAPHQYS